ncbi:MAG: hypothetical protein NTW78_06010 [Campylobacterales bacterium]|nr:hypothetical protein [Campylobacterales bacterium]
MNPIERYIGGGKIFLAKWNGTLYETEVEVGEIQSATLKINPTYTDAIAKDSGIAKKVDKVVKSVDATISFTTQNVNKVNMAMAMLGSDTQTETFAIGDTLPDNTVATVETVIPVIDGVTISKIEARVRIVGVNISGSFNPVLLVHHAVITPTSDLRDFFADKHATLGFNGEVLEVAAGYFKEYHMPKA